MSSVLFTFFARSNTFLGFEIWLGMFGVKMAPKTSAPPLHISHRIYISSPSPPFHNSDRLLRLKSMQAWGERELPNLDGFERNYLWVVFKLATIALLAGERSWRSWCSTGTSYQAQTPPTGWFLLTVTSNNRLSNPFLMYYDASFSSKLLLLENHGDEDDENGCWRCDIYLSKGPRSSDLLKSYRAQSTNKFPKNAKI